MLNSNNMSEFKTDDNGEIIGKEAEIISDDSRQRVRRQRRVVDDWRSKMWKWNSTPKRRQVARVEEGLAHQLEAAGPAASHTLYGKQRKYYKRVPLTLQQFN